jgi:hypothetical protein
MNICDVAAVTQQNTTPLLICLSVGACWLVGWLLHGICGSLSIARNF